MDHLYPYREIIGYLAGALATFAFVPQVLRTLRLRRTTDISLSMYALMVSGICLWLLYGVLIYSWPVILSNVVTLVLVGSMLVLKIRHG